MKRVAILQSNYIPWKGVFDLINSVDEFILYDDVQYTKRDWRNRNKIKTPNGLHWLTIPIKYHSGYQEIRNTIVANYKWAKIHWKTLHNCYAKAPYYEWLSNGLEAIYKKCEGEDYLSIINYEFYKFFLNYLGIKTEISWSMDYHLINPDKNLRLIELCQKAGATHYLSGPSARNYINPKAWEENGIQLKYFSYDGYPEYPQLWGKFEHQVSIVDLLFNTGPHAPEYMLSFHYEH